MRGKFRGVSAGTIVSLCLTALVLLTGWYVFSRISGEADYSRIFSSSVTVPKEPDTAVPAPAATSTPGADPTAVPPSNGEFVLTAAGPVQLGELIINGSLSSAGYDFSPSFSSVSSLLDGNINMVTLRGMPQAASDLSGVMSAITSSMQNAGFNLVNLGSDLVLSSGTEAVLTAQNALSQAGLPSLGVNMNSDFSPGALLLNAGGVRVGIVSCVQQLSDVHKSVTDAQRSTAVRSLEQAVQDVSSLRAQGAQAVIVNVWWGKHNAAKTDASLREAAQRFADAGADIILGMGSSTVLPLEMLTSSDGRRVLTAYSMGTFLSDESRSTDDIMSILLRIRVRLENGILSIASAKYTPTWIMRSRNVDGEYQYQVVPAGSSLMPEAMTGSVYSNMKDAFNSMVKKLGTEIASPRPE